jgi:GLPGLI family protein
MKKWILLTIIAYNSYAQAQQTAGTIIYETKVNLHKRIKNEQARMYMPEFRTNKFELLFNQQTAVYKSYIEPETDNAFEQTENRMVVSFGGGDNSFLYTNWTDKKLLRQTDLGSKTYLITDSLTTPNWTITNETKNINGYTCTKAILQQTRPVPAMRMTINNTTQTNNQNNLPQEETIEVTAWFTTTIQTSTGPDTYGGLPGAIIVLDINNGESVTTALQVSQQYNAKELKEPTKGKKVTKQEYNKLLQQMMENMQQGGGGGMRIMRMGS